MTDTQFVHMLPCLRSWKTLHLCCPVVSTCTARIGHGSSEQLMSPDLCFHPTVLRLSNQVGLICYNGVPSGRYYTNPCDVIPKRHCFHCSKTRATHCLITNRDALIFPATFPLLLSPLWVSQEDKDEGHVIILLLDHFINHKPAVNPTTHTNNPECLWAARISRNVLKSKSTFYSCETVTGSECVLTHTHTTQRWCVIYLCGQPEMKNAA